VTQTSPAKRCISIITPTFNEELNANECYMVLRKLFDTELPEYEYEHIFADNGSTDGTVGILRELARNDRRVKVIVNARNFGPFRSVFNALLSTSGDAVVVFMPADLQDPPALIPQFVRLWEAGNEIVYGIRKDREEGVLMRIIRRIYYQTVSHLSEISIPPEVSEFQLVDRVIIEWLRKCDDYYPYVRGMIANCGFRATGIPFTWTARKKGFSKLRLYHLIDQGLNGIISFSNVPLRLCMLAGMLIAALSLLYATLTGVLSIIYFRELAAPGIPILIVALFFFGGAQLFFLGLLGEYVSAIHSQVRKRPMVIERDRINFEK